MNASPGDHTNQLMFSILEWVTLLLYFACLNASAILEYDQFPTLDTVTGRGWQIVLGYLIVLLLVTIQINHYGLFAEYIKSWSRNPWFILFLGISILSLIWSVYRIASLYEIILLLSSTALSVYFAIRLRAEGMIKALTWFSAVCTVLSLLIVFINPTGIMHGAGHSGSWRGLFWHRNHTGSMMAFFNMIFLSRFLMDNRLSIKGKLVFSLFYILSAVHVFGSRSATGILIFFALNIVTLLAYAWLMWRAKLRPIHYYSLAGLLLGAFILFIFNLEFIFGILGRSATMTGRTRMWPDLINNTFTLKPILGHGFGAIWMQDSFRTLIEHRWGWSYQPYFADNGFLDLLLNLGLIGLAVFLVLFVIVTVRGWQKIRAGFSWKSVFFFITLVYVFIGNLTYSFLFEVDYFVWSLFVIVAFLVSTPDKLPT
jgi:exopolysaccharide production protein ExoQ